MEFGLYSKQPTLAEWLTALTISEIGETDPQKEEKQGRLSLSTVGDKCAKDNFRAGEFIKSLTNFSIQKCI